MVASIAVVPQLLDSLCSVLSNSDKRSQETPTRPQMLTAAPWRIVGQVGLLA